MVAPGTGGSAAAGSGYTDFEKYSSLTDMLPDLKASMLSGSTESRAAALRLRLWPLRVVREELAGGVGGQ